MQLHNFISEVQQPHVCTPIPLLQRKQPSRAHHPTIDQSIWWPHIAAINQFLHWLSPFTLSNLNKLAQHLPPEIIAREWFVVICTVNSKTLNNYGTGLLRFTQFCNHFKVGEDLWMPDPEWLIAHFITTHGSGLVGPGVMKTWLLVLELWHIINGAPWHGSAHLKWASQGSCLVTPSSSTLPKCLLVIIAHLMILKQVLNLSNTFDAAVYVTAMIVSWCQCCLS